jgi:cysteinyl-tRNA synthetase
MPETSVPEEVRSLAAERAEARDRRDFAAADALRERIVGLGYRVVDTPGGFSLEPIAGPRGPSVPPRLRPEQVGSILDEAPTADASIQWVVEGWPEDVLRGIESFRRHEGGRTIHQVVVDVAGTDPALWPEGVEVVNLVAGVGWAAARNCGLRRSSGQIVCIVDGSIEAAGDMIGPLASALADESIGVAGPFGIVTDDLRDFRESQGPDVDAIEGYLMALRRDLFAEVGPLDEKFKFYRTCDIEYSFRVKDTGRRALVVPVPVRRHEHRMWANTDEDRRRKLSKRNYYRFLDRFRGRFDLTVAGDSGRNAAHDHDHHSGDSP